MKKFLLFGLLIMSMLLFMGCEEEADPVTKVDISSNPAGATITLDEQVVGITPDEFEIDPGYHTVILELAGYEIYYDEFSVEEGDTHEIFATLTEMQNTTLTVNTNPSGASVYIDGAYTGYYTPVTFTNIDAGYHFVRIYKPGYNEIVEYIYIQENVP